MKIITDKDLPQNVGELTVADIDLLMDALREATLQPRYMNDPATSLRLGWIVGILSREAQKREAGLMNGKDAQIERLKAEHEEMLLKHERERGIALETLEKALNEIERLRGLLKTVDVSVEKLNYAKMLCTLAADALDCHNLDHLQDDLIKKLRDLTSYQAQESLE